MIDVDIGILRSHAEARLVAAGVPVADACAVVDHMLTADLWGRSTHGLAIRLPYLVRQVEEGGCGGALTVVEDGGTHVLADGRNGVGYAQASACTDLLAERVSTHGLCSLALRNTRHTGMLGYYVHRAARAGVVAMAFSHCCPLMAPHGGAGALLGTNPFAIAFPADPDPILVDMGTSAVTWGDLLVHEREGSPLPEGCALDADGEPTTDPASAREGCVLPFGGHRGGALAVAIQLLAGAFTGSGVFPPPGRDYGLFMLGFRKGLFAGEDGYDRGVGEFVQTYLAAPAREDFTVHLPGAARYAARDAHEAGCLAIPEELAELLGLDTNGEAR